MKIYRPQPLYKEETKDEEIIEMTLASQKQDISIELSAEAPIDLEYAEPDSDIDIAIRDYIVSHGGSNVPIPTPGGDGCDCDLTYTNPRVEQNVGNVKVGESFDKETIQQVLDRIFAPSYAKPSISIGLSTPKNTYDKDTETVNTVTITANVTRRSEDLAYVKFYVDGVVVETVTAAAAAKGGTFKYTYTPDTPINKTTTFKVETCDVTTKSVVSTQAVITFVQKSYYGVMSSILDYTDPDLIVLLNNTLKTSVGMSQKFSCEFGRFLYAHPTAIGTVSSIKDNVNNFNYTDSCQKINITINGGKYELIYLIEPAGFEDLTITFA